jgi:hypothetical protein
MRRMYVALTVLVAMALIYSSSFEAMASVRMRVTGKRTTQPVVYFPTRRAVLLASGYYAEALGVPAPPRQWNDYMYSDPYGSDQRYYASPYGGPYVYGGGGFYGFNPWGYGFFSTGPNYQWGHSPLDPPFPIVY